jgi:hypothetical protein
MPIKSKLRLLDLTPVLMPLRHVVLADVPISATPAEAHSLALPSAGTYLVELQDAFDAGSLGASRNVFWTIGVTNFTSMSMTAISHRTGVAQILDLTQTANNHTVTVPTVSTNNRVRLIHTGVVVVSAAATLTVDVSMVADTGLIKIGSYLKVSKYA